MSADLLAQFDPFYSAPQKEDLPKKSNTQSRSSSALNDLSFFSSASTPAPLPAVSPQPNGQYQAQQNSESDLWGNFNNLTIEPSKTQSNQDDFDAWGDFESPAAPEPSIPTNSVNPPSTSRNNVVSGNEYPRVIPREPQRPTIGRARADTEDFFSGSIAKFIAPSPPRPKPKATPNYGSYAGDKYQSTSNNSVLFDAEDELANQDDDEFGDFEAATSLPQPQQSGDQLDTWPRASESTGKQAPPMLNAASLTPSPFPYPQAPKSPSFQERNPFSELELKTSISVKNSDSPRSGSPVTAWPTFVPIPAKHEPYLDSPPGHKRQQSSQASFKISSLKEATTQKPAAAPRGDSWDWNAFDAPAKSADPKPTENDSWAWDLVDGVPELSKSSNTETPPPTNIPPPSVLLTVFPQLFNLSQTSIFQVVSGQQFSLKNRIMSDPATVDFLRAYILLATVAARIVAGRKQRWKRDHHLSQAMKIGPAAAGGKGGMKLKGVDKSETTREEREAAELVRAWKDQVGRLRSSVAIANSSIKDLAAHLVVPEINDVMPVRTVTITEGGLTAPMPCFLCGLKREERVAKVDVQVEDSFGEWWVEHWGHRACRNFWLEHEGKLKQR
jgi:hypothetical protein